jgi:hypothetical protein
LTSDEWFAGRDASPRLLSMESVYQNAAGGQPSRQREFVPQSTPDVARPLEVTPKPKATETTSKVVSDQEMAQSVFKRPVSSEGDTPAPSTDSNRKEPPKETVSIVEPQSTQAKAAPVTVHPLLPFFQDSRRLNNSLESFIR